MFDEMYADGGSVRPPYEKVAAWIDAAGVDLLKLRQNEAEAIFRRIIESDRKEFRQISDSWATSLRQAFHALPSIRI